MPAPDPAEPDGAASVPPGQGGRAGSVGPPQAPRTLSQGRYRLGRRLGVGGMAVVHEAHDVALDRVVAVKRLRTELACSETARMRFSREARHAATIDHPGVVRVYDSGEEPVGDTPWASVPVPWIVMELVDGITLRDLVDRRGPLPWRQAFKLTTAVLEALEYSHARGIVHRDIKPVNAMLTTGGTVKVMDFGIARALDGASSGTLTADGRIMGTPHYFSPEQALGNPATPGSDVYSVGCLLYELLVGSPPFEGRDAVTIAYRHVRDQPVPPSRHRRDLPGAVDDIVLHALRKDPQLRYTSAALMRTALVRQLHMPQRLAVPSPTRSAARVQRPLYPPRPAYPPPRPSPPPSVVGRRLTPVAGVPRVGGPGPGHVVTGPRVHAVLGRTHAEVDSSPRPSALAARAAVAALPGAGRSAALVRALVRWGRRQRAVRWAARRRGE